MKIYIYGATNSVIGQCIKIGKSSQHLTSRASQRTTGFYPELVAAQETLLLAFHSEAANERRLQRCFDHLLISGEYFRADAELEEYVNWGRHQPFAWLSEDDGPDDQVGWQEIVPTPERRMALPVSDAMITEEEVYDPVPGAIDLRGSSWSRFNIFRPPWNDYYTPLWIIEASRTGMGGIDLDAAAHWSSIKVHQIPNYFTKQHSAHGKVWQGRTWLNPPYGNNEPWIDDVLRNWRSGEMTQLCWLSPSYVFNKQQARPVMDAASLIIHLTVPTDKMFWGYGAPTPGGRKQLYCPPDQPALGRNDPHFIVYLGDRSRDVADAFLATGRGYPTLPYR